MLSYENEYFKQDFCKKCIENLSSFENVFKNKYSENNFKLILKNHSNLNLINYQIYLKKILDSQSNSDDKKFTTNFTKVINLIDSLIFSK